MKKKYKIKKSAIIIMCLILIAFIALIIIFAISKSHSYSVEYNIDDYGISENYDRTEKLFYYEITYNNIDYNFIYNSKYIKERKLIKNINKYEKDDYTCLLIESDYINSKPLCSNKEEIIDYHLVPEEIKENFNDYHESSIEEETTYENYKIYNKDNRVLIWSYKGFNYINKDNIEFIKLFDKDIYDIPHATKINNYLVIPNYEQEYNFNEVYIIDLDTIEVDKWKLDYDISYDSYILGTNDKSIFIIDNKTKREYELVPHKKKMRIVATSNKQGVVYNNGNLEKISMKKLISSNYTFTIKNNYKYTIKDNTLYLSYLDKDIKTKISNQKISSIILIEEDTVYYLVNNTLYKYNIEYGETKLINYSEWEYNNKNLIFIN